MCKNKNERIQELKQWQENAREAIRGFEKIQWEKHIDLSSIIERTYMKISMFQNEINELN